MNVQITQQNNLVVVSPRGYIDEATANSFRRALDDAIRLYPDGIVLDMAEVDFMDSTGIGTMLSRYKLMRNNDIRLSVRNVNPQVDKLFRLTGIYSIINLER